MYKQIICLFSDVFGLVSEITNITDLTALHTGKKEVNLTFVHLLVRYSKFNLQMSCH